ncbi:hypothetical protein J4461_02350 [Candidatus Pacearchaeota archaeon]|nr:hypothetical protein [Candidatus Pacearchaeota archaeon]
MSKLIKKIKSFIGINPCQLYNERLEGLPNEYRLTIDSPVNVQDLCKRCIKAARDINYHPRYTTQKGIPLDEKTCENEHQIEEMGICWHEKDRYCAATFSNASPHSPILVVKIPLGVWASEIYLNTCHTNTSEAQKVKEKYAYALFDALANRNIVRDIKNLTK